jgi:hypothetical protein
MKTKEELAKIERCAPLLPEPAPQVVKELLEEIAETRMMLEHTLMKQALVLGLNNQDRAWVRALGHVVEDERSYVQPKEHGTYKEHKETEQSPWGKVVGFFKGRE